MRRAALVVAALAGCDARPPCPETVPPTPAWRLPRTALERSVEDLLGVEVGRGALPEDAGMSGFDNPAATGGATESFVAAWRGVVADAAARAVVEVREGELQVEVRDLRPPEGYAVELPLGERATWWALAHGMEGVAWGLEVPEAGTWQLSLEVAWWKGWEPIFEQKVAPSGIVLDVGGQRFGPWTIASVFETPEVLQVEVPLAPGRHTIRWQPVWGGEDEHDNVFVLGAARAARLGESASMLRVAGRHVSGCSAATTGDAALACARGLLEPLIRRAWRGPPEPRALDRVLDVVAQALQEGDPLSDAVRLGIEATLLSPRFVYLVEPAPRRRADRWRLDDHALAARVAMTLWRTSPDEALLACADAGELLGEGPCGLREQVRRMLQDRRADALYEDFALQWLQLRNLHQVVRDPSRFPTFSPELVDAMLEEVRQLVLAAVREDRPLPDLLVSDERRVDARLAALYDLARPGRGGFSVVDAPPGERPGLLGSAAVLTATSHPDRTSPVKRGKLVLANLLCDPPPPPPPDVPLLGSAAVEGDGRAALEAHRNQPACAGCHAPLDAYGFALEGFDPVGAARATYADGTPIDPTATLADGTPVASPGDVAAAVAGDPRLPTCFASRLFTWALGRAPLADDADLIAALADPGHPPTFGSVLEELAVSDAFQCRAARVE